MFEAELRRRAEEEIAEIARTCQDLQLQIHQVRARRPHPNDC